MLPTAVSLLGASVSDPRLASFLIGIACPCPPPPDPYGSTTGVCLDALGIEFQFDPRSAYFRETSTTLFLSAVTVYGPAHAGDAGLRPYAGPLVQDLAFSLRPADVRRRLGRADKCVKERGRVLQDHWFRGPGAEQVHRTDLVVRYADDRSIAWLAVLIPHPERVA